MLFSHLPVFLDDLYGTATGFVEVSDVHVH